MSGNARGGARPGAGRKPGSLNKNNALGRKKIYQTISLSGLPEEIEELKAKAAASGKTVSRFILDSLKLL